jgi:hypothetical protein
VLDAQLRVRGDRRGDGAVEHASHRHRRGEVDRRRQQAPFIDLHGAGELAGAVQDRGARGQRLGPQALDRAGHDRGDAAAPDAAAFGRVRLVADDRHVADGHAVHIRDRPRRPGLKLADAQAVLAQASLRVHVRTL